MKRKIVVLSTGGTIEKSFDETDGSISNKQSQIQEWILPKLRLPFTQVEVIPILNKDSLDITPQERNLIVDRIDQIQKQKQPVVVIHGTDTMEQTSRLCYEKISHPSVPIIFTGAMKPMKFTDSDAIQNFTEALFASKVLKPGVYVVFHNEVYEAPTARKNKKLNTFEQGESRS